MSEVNSESVSKAALLELVNVWESKAKQIDKHTCDLEDLAVRDMYWTCAGELRDLLDKPAMVA